MSVHNKIWSYDTKKGQQFVFLHLPKTGGTSFRAILSNHFKEEDRYPSQSELISNNGKYLSSKNLLLSKDKFKDKNLIIGHYAIGLKQHFTKDAKMLTFFRNPIDRIMSHIKHIQKYDAKLKGLDPNIILERRFDTIVYLQARMMGFDISKNNIDEVRKNIRSLDFIGIQERFDESLQICNKAFGWGLESGPKLNVATNKGCVGLSSQSKSKICRNLFPELVAYNTAFKIFEKRLKEQKV